MTLSALSMQMRTLEKDLAVDLFDRAFRPPKLTPLGRRIAHQAECLLAEEARLRGLCGDSDALPNHLRIGFIPSASARVLPHVLKDVRQREGPLALEIETGLSEALIADVRAGKLDAAVVTSVEPAHRQLRVIDLAREPMSFAVPKDMAGVPAKDLATRMAFVHFQPNTGIGRLVSQYLAGMATPPADIIVLDGIEPCVECVRLGLGYTLLPQPELERYRGRDFAIQPMPAPGLRRRLALVARDDAVSATWVPRLRDALLTAVGQNADGRGDNLA